jgi:hypothetical protein
MAKKTEAACGGAMGTESRWSWRGGEVEARLDRKSKTLSFLEWAPKESSLEAERLPS